MVMNCHRVQNLISAYVDGELPGVEMLAVRQHISDCGDCKSEFESILLVKRSISCLAPKCPSTDLAASICMKLSESGTSMESGILYAVKRHLSGVSGGLRLVGVAAGLLVAMTLVGRSGTHTTPLIYSPTASSMLVRSMDESDPVKMFSMHNGNRTQVFRPRQVNMPMSDDWGVGVVTPVSMTNWNGCQVAAGH